MRLTERDTTTPNGLARFLTEHENCLRELEVSRDGTLVTVICHGCESSFSYMTSVAANEPTEVEQALGELSEPTGPPTAAPGNPPAPAPPARRGHAKPVRPPPPGPHARRRRRSRSVSVSSRIAVAMESVARVISARRRPIALAALSLGGAYLLISLGAGSETSSSQGDAQPGGADLPLAASVPADAAEAEDPAITGSRGRFEVTPAPGWSSEPTGPGSTELRAPDGDAEVTIDVHQGPAIGLGGLAVLASKALDDRKGNPRVERIPSRSAGDLLAIAQAKGDDEVATAYVAEADGVQFVVIESRQDDASALTRRQAEGIVRSFEPAS